MFPVTDCFYLQDTWVLTPWWDATFLVSGVAPSWEVAEAPPPPQEREEEAPPPPQGMSGSQ